nr:hypothetical protein [Polymorphobacter sp.]
MGMETARIADGIRIAVPAALLLAALAAHPASAVVKQVKHQVTSTLSIDDGSNADRLRVGNLASFAPSLVDAGKFSFTAPGQGAANARTATVERAFRFTPSGKADNRRAFSVGVTSRVVAAVADTSKAAAPVETAAVTPAAYNVDLAVGWRNFAVSGGYSRSETLGGTLPTSLTPRRDAVDVGVSYRGASWKTSLQIAAETGAPALLTPITPLSPLPADRRYSVEFGGAYLLTPQLSLTGGVRYKTLDATVDPAKRDQSVYFGTAFTF